MQPDTISTIESLLLAYCPELQPQWHHIVNSVRSRNHETRNNDTVTLLDEFIEKIEQRLALNDARQDVLCSEGLRRSVKCAQQLLSARISKPSENRLPGNDLDKTPSSKAVTSKPQGESA